MPKSKLSIKERLLFSTKIGEENNSCWIWQGRKTKGGYGRIEIKCRPKLTHRVSYEEWVGPIPDKMQVLHTCDNPSCINPKHLWLGTQKDNVQDMFKKRREHLRFGVNSGTAKLTEQQVLEIRTKYIPRKYTIKMLSSEYKVHERTIVGVVTRSTWKNTL